MIVNAVAHPVYLLKYIQDDHHFATFRRFFGR